MIDFKEELKKYQPVLDINDIEDNIRETEMKDVLDILHHMKENMNMMDFEMENSVNKEG